jgi:Uma2 family endonuclease
MKTLVPPSAGLLPDHTQLPDKDNMPVRNSLEPWQSSLLTESLAPVLRRLHPQGDYFIGQDVGIYWQWVDPPLRGAKSPDWYYVPDVPHLLQGLMRRSYVLWREKTRPYLILEYASDDGTEDRDRTPEEGKFWVYEHRIQPAFYGIFEPDAPSLEMHRLVEDHFESMVPNEHGRHALPLLGVELGLWTGTVGQYAMTWLRWWDAEGRLLPSPDELADRERQDKEQAQQRADFLAERFRMLGINPDEI